MTLLEEIQSKCPAELIAAKEHGQIAAIVSVGRTKPSIREIGNGTILETIGLQYGNAMLDVIYNEPTFRHVKPLLDQGRLIVGSPLAVAAVQGMVPSIMPQIVADKLLALTTAPDPVSVNDVIKAMEGV